MLHHGLATKTSEDIRRIVINSGIHYGKIDATDHDGRSEIVSIASALKQRT
jgi:hypothetical protein